MVCHYRGKLLDEEWNAAGAREHGRDERSRELGPKRLGEHRHSLALGDNPVPHDELASALLATTNGDKSQPIFLRADRSLPYGDFAEVINLLRRSGFLKIALVGLETDKNP